MIAAKWAWTRQDQLRGVPWAASEATAAILGGNVTISGSSYSEFAEYIASKQDARMGVTSSARLKGVNVPTAQEQGHQRGHRQLAWRVRHPGIPLSKNARPW